MDHSLLSVGIYKVIELPSFSVLILENSVSILLGNTPNSLYSLFSSIFLIPKSVPPIWLHFLYFYRPRPALVALSSLPPTGRTLNCSRQQEVAKRVCPISCPPDSVFEPSCRCKPIPAVEERIRPPICDIFCEFGLAPGGGCQCNPDPYLEKRRCAIYCELGYEPSVPCTCRPDPSIRCGNVCLRGTKHDPHAVGVCN